MAIAIHLGMRTYPKAGLFRSALVGSFCGVTITWMTMYVLLNVIARINGAHFSIGDNVRILIGPHEGKVAMVYDIWKERGQIRVHLGEQAMKDCSDVFSEFEVCRVKKV